MSADRGHAPTPPRGSPRTGSAGRRTAPAMRRDSAGVGAHDRQTVVTLGALLVPLPPIGTSIGCNAGADRAPDRAPAPPRSRPGRCHGDAVGLAMVSTACFGIACGLISVAPPPAFLFLGVSPSLSLSSLPLSSPSPHTHPAPAPPFPTHNHPIPASALVIFILGANYQLGDHVRRIILAICCCLLDTFLFPVCTGGRRLSSDHRD